jgi:3-phosphoshikimate 1-carboxyvinyltransferase
MKKFGVKINTDTPYKKYSISPQAYKPTTFTIPIDFSSLALLISAAILVGEELSINLQIGDLPQGDKLFIDIVESMGVNVTIDNGVLTVKTPKTLTGGRFDLGNTPDLLPPLAILALKSKNPIEVFNVKHARYKETDRIKILSRELSKTGIKIKENEDGMIMKCSDKITGADFNSEDDHRLFMAFSIAGLFIGDCSVSNPESVKISYPDFISDINKVGGKIDFSA